MPNPNTFDEARAAAEEMFANEQLSTEDVPPVEETPPAPEAPATEPQADGTPNLADEVAAAEATATEAPVTEASTMEQAVQTAEAAAQTAVQKDAELQQALAEIEALRQQTQQLQGTIDEMSKQNTEKIINETMTPPTLDLNGLAFADEETQKAEMAKFVEGLSAYNKQELMKELSPALEYAKKGMRDAETKEVISALSQVPELANIQQMLPQLDRIIENNKWLSSDDVPLDEKYIQAYAIARGVDAINNPPAPPAEPKEPTPEELLQMYNNNPAFQELVEKQRMDAIKQSQQVPPFSASSGAVNAALNIKGKPQTLEEASRRTREMFGEM